MIVSDEVVKKNREALTPIAEAAVIPFHWLYQVNKDRTWENTFWFGVPINQCPLDAWVFQEIIWNTRPNIIIETGTRYGGGAFYYASIFDLLWLYFQHEGTVITIDTDEKYKCVSHPRMSFLHGSSTDEQIVQKVGEAIRAKDRVMVVLDSLHTKSHIAQELEIYSRLVTKDCYLIVCDTNIGGNPMYLPDGTDVPAPIEAVNEFLANNSSFVVDERQEKHYLTFNPGGYLKRIL